MFWNFLESTNKKSNDHSNVYLLAIFYDLNRVLHSLYIYVSCIAWSFLVVSLLIMNTSMLLLLLLSHFSHVRLCAIPQTAAHQTPPSLGFSRQEHWSGLPLPSPMHESEVAQSCPTLSDPMDCSPPGSSVPGIFRQEWKYWSGVPLPSPEY